MSAPTRDEVIRMAREVYGENTKWEGAALERLERFAHLVAEHRDKWWEEQVKVEVHEAVLDEREACAKVCEPTEEHRRDASWGYLGGTEGVDLLDNLAAAIRARVKP